MSYRSLSTRRVATIATSLALAGGLAVGVTAPASAQSAGGDPVSLLLSPLIVGSNYAGSAVPLGSTLEALGSAGSMDAVASARDAMNPPHPVRPGRNDAITETRVVGTSPLYPGHSDPEFARAEVWRVNSAAMQREVRVEVYRAPEGTPAPIVYFLDGVGSEVPSGWSGGMGFRDNDMRSRNVTVVAPTGGPSSMWADWNEDDPTLGPNLWETFLTEELPPLLESDLGDLHNGQYGTLGISMGGGPALSLVNNNPDMFDAAAAVSGCFSTLDELGYQYTRLTVEARGGNVANLWGPRGSERWRAHDTVSDVSGLAGKSVYLSAATGLIGVNDFVNFGSHAPVLLDGSFLERGSYECTRALESSLRDAGVTHRVDYDPFGIHNWPVFVPRITSAMQYILPALGVDAGPIRPDPVMGSLGSVSGSGDTASQNASAGAPTDSAPGPGPTSDSLDGGSLGSAGSDGS